LIFSVVYFANPFTWRLALGSFLVFSGTLIFSDVPQSIYQKIKDRFQPAEHVKAD
jgi:hypothetical protein